MSDKRRDGGRPHGEPVSDVPTVPEEAGEPMTARQVDAAPDREPTRTTRATVLTRLHAKGTLRRILSGRCLAREPVRDATGFVAGRTRRGLESEPRRELVPGRFVSCLLSESDEDTSRRPLLEAGDGSR
ncbi:BlaI/MecI/CopY family transcriptional regulator [Streptomyces sp. NPDC057950]|uniref:BlaI/MecI/CopY family transcriptional regulator n=1 Tax=Streptomyces sp. NPDC057950 TaxID=3346288 RepID=UPI0036ED0470